MYITVFAFCFLCLSQNVDDQVQVIVIGNDPQSQTIELGGMVEGVARRYEFIIRNDADIEIRDLSTRVSCGCLRATELEGKTLPAKGELKFKATVLPTSNTYNQKLSLGGVTADGIRKEIAVAQFTGKVAVPLDCNPKSLSIPEMKSGPVRVKIVAKEGIHFDLKKAVLPNDRFRLEVSGHDEILVSSHLPTIAEQVQVSCEPDEQ